MTEIHDITSYLEIVSPTFVKRERAQFHVPIWQGQRNRIAQ